MATLTQPRYQHTVHRGGDPSFSINRFLQALLVKDSRPVEIFMGAFIVGMRGLMLLNNGFSYPAVAHLLHQATITSDRLGALLMLCGVAQVVATGTGYRRVRPFIAFAGSMLCFLAYVAYLGAGLADVGMAYSWGGLFIAEVALCWRIMLSTQVQDPNHDHW